MRRHFIHVWHALSDMVVLALVTVCGFALSLLTEPWLHATRYTGSTALERMARSGQVWWGVFGFVIVVLAVAWQPRWFGMVAVVALVSVRGYDFWHDDQHDWFFLGVQVVFFALAIRGTMHRTARYG